MEKRKDGDRFPELFGLIEEYARGDNERQTMALKVVGGAYLPSLEARGLRDPSAWWTRFWSATTTSSRTAKMGECIRKACTRS